jgi:hypothetical protein
VLNHLPPRTARLRVPHLLHPAPSAPYKNKSTKIDKIHRLRHNTLTLRDTSLYSSSFSSSLLQLTVYPFCALDHGTIIPFYVNNSYPTADPRRQQDDSDDNSNDDDQHDHEHDVTGQRLGSPEYVDVEISQSVGVAPSQQPPVFTSSEGYPSWLPKCTRLQLQVQPSTRSAQQ